ncbi:MAG TPA: hypothetical protein VF458_11175, partial [Ktedonobacteraceae bacterium]
MFRSQSPDVSTRFRKLVGEQPSKVKPTRQGLLRLLGFARPYWWQLGTLMVMAFVASSLTLAI